MSELNSVNPELNTKQITMSDHAYKRAAERFNKSNRTEALGYFRGILRKSKRIGDVVAEDGNVSILYGCDRHAIYLRPDLTTIITVNKFDHFNYVPIKSKIVEIAEKEYRKYTRREKAMSRRLKLINAESDLEIAELNLRILKTRSQSVKNSCHSRIAALKQYICQLEEEIKEIQSQKRQLSRSIISMI